MIHSGKFDHLVRLIEDESIRTKVMLGNKLDLESERRISYEDARHFATERGFHYFETSAKDGTNVSEALGFAVVDVLQQPAGPAPAVAGSRGGDKRGTVMYHPVSHGAAERAGTERIAAAFHCARCWTSMTWVHNGSQTSWTFMNTFCGSLQCRNSCNVFPCFILLQPAWPISWIHFNTASLAMSRRNGMSTRQVETEIRIRGWGRGACAMKSVVLGGYSLGSAGIVQKMMRTGKYTQNLLGWWGKWIEHGGKQ